MIRAAAITSIGSGIYCGSKANQLAIQTYPNVSTWNTMKPTEKGFEYVRHGILIGSGCLLGSFLPPVSILLFTYSK